MLSILSFSCYESSFHHARCEGLPFKLFAGKSSSIELNRHARRLMVASRQKIRVNNTETCFAQVKPFDVIVSDKQLFILIHADPYGNRSFYVGRIQYNNAAAFLFNAPEKVYAVFFQQLSQMISHYPAVKQIIINCQAIIYMDSESIAAMMTLINIARQHHCMIYFYAPNHKFNSYITLSNIVKFICQIPPGPSVQAAMESINRDSGQTLFALRDQSDRHGIKSDRITYVGRSIDSCDISIHSSSVSRVHAAIIIIQNSLYVMDFGSTNGTFLSETKIVPFTLQLVKLNERLFFGNTPPYKMVLY